MTCIYCGGTGKTKSGEQCTRCIPENKNIEGSPYSNYIPKLFKDTSFLEASSKQLYEILENYDKNCNYIIHYKEDKDGTNEELSLIFVYDLIRRLIKNNEVVLPLFTQLHLNGLVKALYWNKETVYNHNTIIYPEDLMKSSILPIKISEKLDKFEQEDLYKLIEMRCLNNSGLVIISNNTNFIKTKKIYNIQIRGLI